MVHRDENRILELFGKSTRKKHAWQRIVSKQQCPFTNTKCFKVRKSEPDVSIGTCSMRYGKEAKNVIICPNRLLERKQVFTDCLHLLTLHEPGNELHVVSELSIPGGSVDFVLASVQRGRVTDFVAIEFQTLDTTGTVWPDRQRLLRRFRLAVPREDVASKKTFGMNWKMTAKTILVQLHHKVPVRAERMTDVHPTVRYLILCEDVLTDPQNPRRITLVALTSSIRSLEDPPYPLPYRELCVFLQMTECRGPAEGWIEIHHDELEVAVLRIPPQAMNLTANPLEIVGTAFRIRDLVFPEPGLYWVQFRYNDKTIAQQPLLLR